MFLKKIWKSQGAPEPTSWTTTRLMCGECCRNRTCLTRVLDAQSSRRSPKTRATHRRPRVHMADCPISCVYSTTSLNIYMCALRAQWLMHRRRQRLARERESRRALERTSKYMKSSLSSWNDALPCDSKREKVFGFKERASLLQISKHNWVVCGWRNLYIFEINYIGLDNIIIIKYFKYKELIRWLRKHCHSSLNLFDSFFVSLFSLCVLPRTMARRNMHVHTHTHSHGLIHCTQFQNRPVFRISPYDSDVCLCVCVQAVFMLCFALWPNRLSSTNPRGACTQNHFH